MITAILIVSAIVLVVFQYLSVKRPPNFPPGPNGVPLLGYAPFVRSPIDDVFADLSKKYGNIFGMFLGSYPVVVLSDLKLVKEAFGNERMSARPELGILKDLTYGGGKMRGIAFSSGKAWQEQRRFAMKTLRNFGFGKASMEAIIMEEVLNLINGLKQGLNRPVCLSDRLLMATMNSLWFEISGERCTHEDHNAARHIHKIVEVLKNLGAIRSACLAFTPGITRAFPEVSGFKYLIDTVNETYDYLKETVDAHKKSLDIDNPRNVIDAFLQEIGKTMDPMSSFWKEEGEKQLLTTLLDLSVGGADTTSSTINWALLYLITNPDIQEKIHTEIAYVVGENRMPFLADRIRMPYMEAVMAETLRFSSIASLGIPHYTTEAMQLNGYEIPKNVVILAHLRQIHFDKERWSDPETFRRKIY